jgi:hypothetical protein
MFARSMFFKRGWPFLLSILVEDEEEREKEIFSKQKINKLLHALI